MMQPTLALYARVSLWIVLCMSNLKLHNCPRAEVCYLVELKPWMVQLCLQCVYPSNDVFASGLNRSVPTCCATT